MQINDIAQRIDGRILHLPDKAEEVINFYAGDFLSRVISKAPDSCCWLTVMNNLNVVGVAVLADIRVIVLCEGVDGQALTGKCKEEGVALIETKLGLYDCCVRLNKQE